MFGFFSCEVGVFDGSVYGADACGGQRFRCWDDVAVEMGLDTGKSWHISGRPFRFFDSRSPVGSSFTSFEAVYVYEIYDYLLRYLET